MKISSKKVKGLMGVRLMTQQALADVTGVSRTTINTTLLKGSCNHVRFCPKNRLFCKVYTNHPFADKNGFQGKNSIVTIACQG